MTLSTIMRVAARFFLLEVAVFSQVGLPARSWPRSRADFVPDRGAATPVYFRYSKEQQRRAGAKDAARWATSEPGGPLALVATPDREQRSRQFFLEASRVLLNPRCTNCHPAGDSPTQGEEGRLHDPPVTRGPDGFGVPGMQCFSCHQDENLELARIPGAPDWHLAPAEMAWAGKSPGAICRQIKDPKRNGGRTLDAIVDHVAHNSLVAWAWKPGSTRAPAPGTQSRLGAIFAAWVDTGAECPAEGEVK